MVPRFCVKAQFPLTAPFLVHYFLVVDPLDSALAAVADPTRRAMVKRLARGPASVHVLMEPFALSQQMISKHIAVLVHARLVVKTKRGRESVCTLRPEAIKMTSAWVGGYRQFWEESFDRFGRGTTAAQESRGQQ